jgi:hypothetical protein
MSRRPPTRLPVTVVVTVVAAAAGVATAVATGVTAATGVAGVAAVVVVVTGVTGVGDVLIDRIQGRGRSVRVRRTRSSGRSGGVGWRRVSLGGNMRRLLHACASVDRLVDYLLDRAVEKLPAAASARFAEEWQDHRQHYSGWRLVWWALCVRATAMRTDAVLGPAGLPRDS